MTRRLWSINALATELGMDRRTVARRLSAVPADGELKGSKGWYLGTALQAIRPAQGGDALDLNAERARREKAAADRLEMQNAQLRGELLPRVDVDAAVIEDYSRVRARLLAIPSKVAPYLVDIPEPALTAETVRAAIHEALAELSDPETLLDAGAGRRPGNIA